MPPSFKKSNYVNIVRELLPDLGRDGTTIQSEKYPDLKHVILCSDVEEKGMINYNSLYDWAGPTNAKEVENRE